MMLPVLRADFEICDTYRYQPEPALDVPIRALFGVDDHSVGRERMQAWSAHTLASFDFSEHPGGAFLRQSSVAVGRERAERCPDDHGLRGVLRAERTSVIAPPAGANASLRCEN